jgi:hypothetical protein
MHIFFLLAIFLTCIQTALWGYRYELAVGMIFRDEAPYLAEWIEYHLLVGVRHFYLFNHQSTDNYRKVLAPYIRKGYVELFDASIQPDFNGTQVDCYNRTLIKSYKVAKWVAMIDSDEFLVSPNGKKIPQLLKDFKHYGGVVLNWQNFGTAGYSTIPTGKLMIECLTRCAPVGHEMNSIIKSVVRPERVSSFKGPHWPEYVHGWYSVDVDHKPMTEGKTTPFKKHTLWINHYWTRDEQFFHQQKIPRSTAWGRSVEWMLDVAKALNSSSDHTILKQRPALRKRLFKK